MGPTSRSEKILLGVALLATVATVVVYVARFSATPIGDPQAWSLFGDYFSGILNPIIGVVTVVLVVRTIQTTRKEAADSRRQMGLQIEHLEKQSLLADMQKRLDGALAEWTRLLDAMAPAPFQSVHVTNAGHSFTERSVRYVLEDNVLWMRLHDQSEEACKRGEEFCLPEFNEFKHDVVPLICELDRYCNEYEEVAGSRHLADFYRARVRRAARTLNTVGLLPHSVAARYARVAGQEASR